MTRFSEEEVRRYARQMVLPEVGGVGQERLRAASAHARSEAEALYLAAAGVGSLTVESVGIAEAARALNPLVEVRVANPSTHGDADVVAGALRAVDTLRQVLGL
jgi:adenylyltransferase/sulfurtransferase